MELEEAFETLRKKDLRRIDSNFLGYKFCAYTIKYKNETIYRIDIHSTKQKMLECQL